MKPSNNFVAGLLGIFLGVAPVVHAGFAIANGDFQTEAGNNVNDVTEWFDDNIGNFWESAWQTNNANISHDGTGIVVFSAFDDAAGGDPNDGGYLYQSIGTADGAAALKLSFDWGGPKDAAAGRDLGLTVAVYAYDGVGAFTPGDGVDVRGAAGVTLLDSVSLVILDAPAGGPRNIGEQVTLDLTGAGTQQLFIRFNNYEITDPDQSWVYLDNVAILLDVPTFITQPADFIGNVGDNITLTAAASSDPAPTFQWEYSPDGLEPWTPIDGETEATLVLNPSFFGDNGFYRVVATNANGSDTSNVAEVSLSYPQPGIIEQPVSTAVQLGSNASFSVTASGLGDLSYQWYKDGEAIDGAILDTLSITDVQLSDAGEYEVEVTDHAAEGDGESATTTFSNLIALMVYEPWSGLASHDPVDPAAGYTEGELPGQNPAVVGYSGAWTDIDFGNAEPAVSAGALVYSDPKYLGSSGAKVAVTHNITDGEITANNSGRVYRLLDAPLMVNDGTTGTRYLSLLFQSGQETGVTTFHALELKSSADGENDRSFAIGLTTNDGQTGNQYNFGVRNAYTSTGVAADTNVHLLVVKFDLSASADSDSVTVWVDPTLGAGEPAGGTTVSGVNMNWDRLVLSDYDGNSAAWDEIRWGSSFDSVTLNPNPADDFAAWIAGYPGVGSLTGFNDDADGDGIDNGLENLFGTDPSVSNQGIVQIAKSGNTVTFQHPQSATSASDVSASYVWSTDLVTFLANGATAGGVTVDFATSTESGTTTVTGTITGTVPNKLFVSLQATQSTP